MRRRKGEGTPRPVFLWADEAQNFLTDRDAEYQAVARSGGGCTVYLTQQRESLRRALKSDDATENLLANLTTKFLCQNTGATNEWASNLIGERYLQITTTNIGRTAAASGALTDDANASAGVSRAEQKRRFIEAERFTRLKRGGVANDHLVEAVVYIDCDALPSVAEGRALADAHRQAVLERAAEEERWAKEERARLEQLTLDRAAAEAMDDANTAPPSTEPGDLLPGVLPPPVGDNVPHTAWDRLKDYIHGFAGANEAPAPVWTAEDLQGTGTPREDGSKTAQERLDDYTAPMEEALLAGEDIPARDGLSWFGRAQLMFSQTIEAVSDWAHERWDSFVAMVQERREDGRDAPNANDPELGR